MMNYRLLARSHAVPVVLASVIILAFPNAGMMAQQLAGAEPQKHSDDLQRIAARYELDEINDLDAWHDLTLEYFRGFPKVPVVTRLDIARRYRRDGAQAEFEAYPRISRRAYLFLSAAASGNHEVFLPFRAAAETYLNFDDGWESSIGMRYLQTMETPVYTVTGTGARYFGNNWVSVRPSLSTKAGIHSYSAYTVWRRYFTGRYDYFSGNITFIRGLDPEARDPKRVMREKFLNSFAARIDRHRPVAGRLLRVTYSAGFEREEVASSRFRNRIKVGFGLEWFTP